MQAAFRECHGLQCGFCTPGMVMSAVQLLKDNPKASEERDPRGPGRQHLPLHRLPQHRQGDPVLPVAAKTSHGLKEQRHERHDLSQRRHRLRSAKSVQRREDRRFLTGAGQYTDDVVLPGQTYGVLPALARTRTRASARSTSTRRRRRPACVEIFTGADLAEAKVGGLPCGWLIHSKDGTPMKEPAHPVLAQGKVRHVGDQVALVVAETLLQAKDAAELIEVDYEELPAVIDITQGRRRGAPVHDDVPDNVCYDWGHGNKDAVDAAFARPRQRHASSTFVNNRLIPNAMEPRAANASYTGTTRATRSTSRTRTRTSSAC